MIHPFVPPRAARAMRRCAYFAHLWIGLILGLYFVLMGLTGVLLLFENEIDAATHRTLFTVFPPAGAAARPIDDLVAAVTRRHPSATISAITLPQTPGQSLRVGFSPVDQAEGGSGNGGPARGGRGMRREAFVNPYTGMVIGERQAGGTFFPQVLRLHHQFLLEDVGQTLNRWGVLFLIVLLVSGLWLWWPSVRNFARQFRMRTTLQKGATGRRFLFDLHNMVGFYSSLLLLIIALTGASYFWKPQTIAIVSTLTGTPMAAQQGNGPNGPGGRGPGRGGFGGPRGDGPRGDRPLGGSGAQMVSYAAVLATAQKVFPKLPVLQISRGRGGLRVTKALPTAYDVRPRLITLSVNERDGSLQSTDLPDQSPLGLQVMGWLMPIHEGQWGYGPLFYVVKAVHAIAGLAPLALFVTGLLMWISKRRGKIANRRRAAGQAASDTRIQEEV